MDPAFGGSNPPAPATRPRGTRSRRLIAAALRAGVTCLLLGWLLSRADLSLIGTALAQASPAWIAAAFSLLFVGILISAVRWRLLLRAQGSNATLGYLAQSLLVGIFFNNFLPSTVGGDLMRARDTAAHAGSGTGALTVVLVERASGILVLGFFALFAPLAGALGEGRAAAVTTTVTVVLLSGFAAFVLALRPRPLGAIRRAFESRAGSSTGSRAAGAIGKIDLLLVALERMASSRGVLRAVFLLAFLLQVNVVLHYWCVAKALGLPLGLADLLLIVPVATVLLLLPVSVNGIGAREAVFALLLGRLGVPLAATLAFSWIVYGTVLVQGLLGGLLYAAREKA